jgi:hypothetical protein
MKTGEAVGPGVLEQDTVVGSIRDNLRYWMAALIQAKIDAPCKEKKSVPSVTAERMEQLP